MSATPDALLAERRLRSAELALEAARRRVRESEAEVRELRDSLATALGDLDRIRARADSEPDRLRRELADLRDRRLVADQALVGERERREELEREFALVRLGETAGGGEALAASESRVAELTFELEVVRRQAAEFEHRTRLALEQAWATLEGLGRRVAAVAEAVGELATRSSAGDREDSVSQDES